MNRSTATRYLVWVSTLLWIGLAATGVSLFFLYQPSTPDVDTGLWPTTLSAWLQDGHLWLGVAAVLATAVLAIASFFDEAVRSSISIAGLVLTVVTFATGLLLPWDALALVAVTVGTDVRGYLPLWSGEAVFVLIGDSEVSLGTMQRWLIVHLLLAATLLATTLLATRALVSRAVANRAVFSSSRR